MADQLVGIISNNMIRSNIQRWTTHHGTIITRTDVVSTSDVSVCTLLCYPAYGKRQPCTVVSVRTTELKTHHAERGAAHAGAHTWKFMKRITGEPQPKLEILHHLNSKALDRTLLYLFYHKTCMDNIPIKNL